MIKENFKWDRKFLYPNIPIISYRIRIDFVENDEPKIINFKSENGKYLFKERSDCLYTYKMLLFKKKKKSKPMGETIEKVELSFSVGEGAYKSLKTNSLEHPENWKFEKKVFQRARQLFNAQFSFGIDDYATLVDLSVENLLIEYVYEVYKGKLYTQPMQKKTFIHHDLLVARRLAFDFYEKAVEDSHPLEHTHLVLYSRLQIENPHYLMTTDPSREEYLEVHRKMEKEYLASQGFPTEGIEP